MAENNIGNPPDGFEFVRTEDGKILYHVPCQGEWFLIGGRACQVKEYPHILCPLTTATSAPIHAPAPKIQVEPHPPCTGGNLEGADAGEKPEIEALKIQLGLAKNRINELEELAAENAKQFAAINKDNGRLIQRCRELQGEHDAGAATNLEIAQLGG